MTAEQEQKEPELIPLRIEFTGQVPPPGRQWCACCALRYMGALSTALEFREHAKEMVEAALEQRHEVVTMPLPKQVMIDGYPSFILRVAITEAPSVYYPEIPLPVCWVHIQGMHPEGREKPPSRVPSGLIPGKKYGVPKGAEKNGN